MDKYAIITPVRDEEEFIKLTLESVISQTIAPAKWIIVDDGSCDQTPRILDSVTKEYPWIQVIHRPNRGFRKSGGGVVEAFYDGFAALRATDWDFLVKLDGDLSFQSDYFQKCIEEFRCDPNLGLGGGMICRLENGQLKEDSIGDPPFHVRGATKIYRRECWKQISPLVQAPGWDTIDEVKANMHGWTTRTFRNLKLVQHKPTGFADGSWRNWFKNGLANYMTGYHPVFMLAKCVKRTFQKPRVLAALALWAGFCSGYLRGIKPPGNGDFICYLRQQQLRRLFKRPSIYC